MIEKTITGLFDLNFLKACNTPVFLGPNSIGFRILENNSRSYYYLKFTKIPEGFSLNRDNDLLKKICSFRNDLFLPFLDICILENPFYFSGTSYGLITLHPFKEINPIWYFERYSYNYKMLINFWILKAFNELHLKDILHGDINIQNIGLTTLFSKTIPILYDLNILKKSDNSKLEIFISPEFMAPEVIESGIYDLKSELWAIGVLLFAINTKELPFGRRSKKSINILSNINQLNIDKAVEKSPQSIRIVIKGLLKLNPNERLSIDEAIDLMKKESNWLFRILIN